MTNSGEIEEMIVRMLEAEGGWDKTRRGEKYCEKMSEELFKATIGQMRRDGRIQNGEVGAVVPTDEAGLRWDWENWGALEEEFYDDISGQKLDPVLEEGQG